MTYTPFTRSIATTYGAVERYRHAAIMEFNIAATRGAKAAARKDEDCAICHDTLAPPASGVPQLALSRLECKHTFHETCILQWLSPFQVTTKLDLRASTPRAVTEYSPAADPFERIPDLLRLFDRVIEREEHRNQRAAALRHRDTQQDLEEIIEEMREEHRHEQDWIQDRMRRADMLRHGIVPQTVSIPDTYEEPTVTHRLSPAKSHCCPICRQNAFSTRPPTGSDTIQLLRVRQRLTDLAYAIFGFERTKQEERARNAIIVFLSRRYADTIAEGEQEVTPSPADCRGIFNIAQEILRKNISDYRYQYKLSTIEQLRVVQLDLVFANWELGEQNIPYFFDPRPPQSELRVDLSRGDMRALGEDPKKFFRTIRFPETTSTPRDIRGASEPSAKGSLAKTPIHVDEDVEMPDAIQ